MKKKVIAKIGTHSSCELVLWNDKPYKEGDIIYAMKSDTYNSLHWSWRRIKHNNIWREYLVNATSPILFVQPW